MAQTHSENPQIKQEDEQSDNFVSPNAPHAACAQANDYSVNANLDISSLVNHTVWSLADQLPHLEQPGVHPLETPFLFQPWIQPYENQPTYSKEQECQPIRHDSRQAFQNQDHYIFSTVANMMPPTPPVAPIATLGLTDEAEFTNYAAIADLSPPHSITSSLSAPAGIAQPPVSSSSTSRSNSASSILKSKTHTFNRRHSADAQRSHSGKRSSHPSVASVVSLTAHEPVAKIIDGIEHITFLYSHDRLVKEYTVRTDVENVNLDDISINFRIQNAIYPRANVDRSDYDGNRWDYETTCNQLGWKLCWLNREHLFGRRGLIQRAVDSYRNRHADMRSRRVTRQEKVANGTLRKRRVKKSIAHII